MADYVSGIFVEADYVATDYVGTDADLYVEAGYVSGVVDAGTVTISASATVTTDYRVGIDADATLNTQATVTATGDRLFFGSSIVASLGTVTATANQTHSATADVSANVGGTQWYNAETWDRPRQPRWEGVTAVGIKVKGGIVDINSAFTVTAISNPVFAGTSIVATLGTVTAVGDRLRFADSDITSAVTVTATSERARDGVVIQASSASVSASAITVKRADASITSAFTFDVDSKRVRAQSSIIASLGTVTADSRVAFFEEVDINSAFTVQAVLEIQADASIASAFSVVADGDKLAGDTVELTAQASVSALGGAAFIAEADINAFASSVIVGRKYVIDPYRVFTVKNESRTLVIAPELRKISVTCENRLNTLERETRSLKIKSETRDLTILNLTLVENASGPLDTREG